jgi:hypothetical protein
VAIHPGVLSPLASCRDITLVHSIAPTILVKTLSVDLPHQPLYTRANSSGLCYALLLSRIKERTPMQLAHVHHGRLQGTRPVAWLIPPAFGFVPLSMAEFRWYNANLID